MALAIAVHNIPEGVIVAAPVFAATGNRWAACGLALASVSTQHGLFVPLCCLRQHLASLLRFMTAPRRIMLLMINRLPKAMG